MSASSHSSARWRNMLYAVAVVLAACLIAAAIFYPSAVAAGWLIGFLFWSQILIGCLLLLMIHRLTSGRWGETIASVIVPAVIAIPALLLLGVPFFIAIPALYPWFHDASTIKPDVLSLYLNAPLFVVRSLVALGGWVVLSMILLRTEGDRRGKLVAALGLTFSAIAVSSVGIDWYLSEEAPFASSSFGASVAVTQLIAGMAWALLCGPEAESDNNIGDLGALLLAFILGLTYIDFMAVLVIWYGDVPREETWFVVRGPWLPLGIVSFFLISVIPIFSLLLARVRASRGALRLLGALVLVGLGFYDAYLIAPAHGVASLFWALLSVATIGLALSGWLSGVLLALLSRGRLSHVS